MVTLIKLTYTFNVNAVSFKIPTEFLTVLEKPIVKFIWKQKGARIEKSVLDNKSKAPPGKSIANPDKLCHKATG